MYDFIRVASAVPDVSVGDVSFNLDMMKEKISEASEKNPDIIVFPELGITGYTCADLFFQDTLIAAAEKALLDLTKISKLSESILVAGAPLKIDGELYNCGIVICSGIIYGIIPKTFIPNYNEFYEKRWFSSARDIKTESILSSDIGIEEEYSIPVGNNLLFRLKDDITFGVEICEDLWAPISPSDFLSVNGAHIILNLSASNETISKRAYRRELVKMHSAKNMSAYVYTSAGNKESTTDLIFSGHSIIAENGMLAAENSKLLDSGYILVSDIDIGKIKSDRLKYKTFSDCRSAFSGTLRPKTIKIPYMPKSNGSLYKVNRLPFVPSEKTDRISRCMDIFKMQSAALSKRVQITNGKMIVGVSGGLDSTLALLVCAKTANDLKLTPDSVIGITMPGFGTTDRTHDNSIKLMNALGIKNVEISIKDACVKHFDDIGHNIDIHDLTYENSQARERTQILMDYAGKAGGFVVGTGDLSELALGWCTYNADHMSMYGVNCGIPKTLVKWMIDSIADYNVFPSATEVLKDIVDTPISPELLPPDSNGNIVQQTEDIVGPYELHDFFLYYVLRFGFSPSKIYFLAKTAFSGDYSEKIIFKWLRNFYRRFFTQQFKRSCLPDGVKIGSVCLSPRGDWRMPSDASSREWLTEIERLKEVI